MKNLFLNISIVILTINLSFSQSVNIDIAREQLLMSKDISIPIAAEGSPYIDKGFSPAKVSGYDDILYTGRFNAYNGEMEINLGEKVIALAKDKPYEVTFTQNNKVYRTYRYNSESGVSKDAFLVVVKATEQFELLKKEVITYHDKVFATTSYQQDKPANFKREDDIYFLNRNKVITYLPSRSKDFIKAFPQNAKAIKTFIKKNKLSTKNEADLIEIVNHIVSL
jgi:hypothetical protein